MRMKKNCVLNDYGVVIKKCCASCAHKALGTGEDQRICLLGEGAVPKNYICADWEMAKNYRNIKLVHRGQISKPHYVQWHKNEVSKIDESACENKEKKIAIMALPSQYEKEFGPRRI